MIENPPNHGNESDPICLLRARSTRDQFSSDDTKVSDQLSPSSVGSSPQTIHVGHSGAAAEGGGVGRNRFARVQPRRNLVASAKGIRRLLMTLASVEFAAPGTDAPAKSTHLFAFRGGIHFVGA